MSFHLACRVITKGAPFALLATSAYFQALGVTRLAGSAISTGGQAGPEPLVRAASRRAAGVSTDDHATNARWIIERNPFDSFTPRPLDAAVTNDPSRNPTYVNAPLCDGFKAVVAVVSEESTSSLAVLSAPGESHPRLVRIGNDAADGRKVQVIEWNRVVLSRGSQLCQLQMFQPSATPISAVTRPRTMAGLERASDTLSEIESHIQKVAIGEFDIDRHAVERILANHMELTKGVRIVPEQRDGKMAGIRLWGIRPNSLLATLGFEDGDRLQSINDLDVTSPERALEAYARLRSEHSLTVQIHRRGRNQNIDFNIR